MAVSKNYQNFLNRQYNYYMLINSRWHKAFRSSYYEVRCMINGIEYIENIDCDAVKRKLK